MQKETKQEMQQETKQEMSYEEALKAFKAQWKEKKAEEKKQAKKAEKETARKQDTEKVNEALAILDRISNEGKTELKAVFVRLNMFINGERYTRNKGGNN